MGARSGNNYLSALKKLGAEVWFEGVRVPNITTHEVLGAQARSIASLYDLQMEKPEAMTFRTSDGGRAGMSFIQPRSADEVRKRGRMMKIWADYSCGMMRDTPDVANLALAAMSAASGFFAQSDRRHGENIESYYREACTHDWCLCLGLQGADVSALEPGSDRPLRIVEQTNEGLIVEGRCWASALLPASEELLVLPARASRQKDEPSFGSAFAIPSNTRGLKLSASRASSRFVGVTCVATFENVVVPWKRVFVFRDVDRARALLQATGVTAHSSHQAALRNLAKGEFMVGLAELVAEAGNIASDEAVRQRLGHLTSTLETMRANVQQAEADATANQWGIFAPAPGAFEQCIAQASRLQSQLADLVRVTNRSPAPTTSTEDTSGDLETAIETARRAAGSISDAASSDASLKPIVERVREFIARLD